MTGAHWALAIHGGAGGRASDTRQHEVTAIRETLIRALEAGAQLLAAGESAVQAAQAAVKVMEASGVLHAGRGAVLNHEGYAELDAAAVSWVQAHWKYKPAFQNGIAVTSQAQAAVKFDLRTARG